jgi:hypothetical protein
LKEFADWPTFPQLWVEGELVGGLDIVRSSFNYFEIAALTLVQVKEEISNDPEFLKPFSVVKTAVPATESA